GRARSAPPDHRQHSRLRALARLLPAAGGHVLVAGRLGVGGRPVRRAAAELVLRYSHPGLSRPLRRGEGILPPGEVWHPQFVSLSDGAEADDEGRSFAEAEIPVESAL